MPPHHHDHDPHHSHAHSHGPAHHLGKSKKELWFVLVLSGGYMFAEIIGGVLSNSLALLADAGHMAIDTAAIGLSLFAIWISQKPPTDEKTYGYYRAEILAALVNGATLIAISFWIFYEAYLRFSQPPEIQGKLMGIVAAGGLAVNFVGLMLMHRGRNDSLNLQGVWLHLITDTLGSLSALIAAGLIWKFHWNLADPIISIAIGILILFGSWKLVWECVNVLLEGVPKHLNIADIKTGIEALENVGEVHDLHVWTVASGVHALSAHVKVSETADHALVLKAITLLLQERFRIGHVTLQLEPGAYVNCKMHF